MTYHISFDWVLAFDTTEMVCWRRAQRLDYYWCWWNVCVAAVSRSMWIPPNRDHCSRPMCSNRRHCRRNSNRIHGQPRNWLRVCDRIRRRCRRHLAVSLHSPMPHRSCKRPLFASSNAAGQKNWVFFRPLLLLVDWAAGWKLPWRAFTALHSTPIRECWKFRWICWSVPFFVLSYFITQIHAKHKIEYINRYWTALNYYTRFFFATKIAPATKHLSHPAKEQQNYRLSKLFT